MFTLDEGGEALPGERPEDTAARLRGDAISLDVDSTSTSGRAGLPGRDAGPRPAGRQELRDYYTEQEMVKFKKVKKRKVVRAKKPLSEALGLEPMDDQSAVERDHGSRGRQVCVSRICCDMCVCVCCLFAVAGCARTLAAGSGPGGHSSPR